MIDAIIALGDNQMTNMFQLVFPNGIPGADDADSIALRMDQDIDPPEDSVNVYEIFYKGMKIPFTGTMDETDKTLTMQVRLDQQWKAFDDLKNYKDLVFNSNTGTRLPTGPLRITIAVQAVDGANNVVKTIFFKGALLKGLKIATFDNNTSDPSRLSLTWIFSKVDYE